MTLMGGISMALLGTLWIWMAGIIEGPGPYAAPTDVLASTPEQAADYIRRYAELNYDQVKIYSSVEPHLVEPIARTAHRHGLRVSGHIPAGTGRYTRKTSWSRGPNH